MILQELFLCIFQFVLCYFPSIYYGISEYIERIPLSHLKLEFLGVGVESVWIVAKAETFYIPLLFPCY